ncbi:MAG TPA: sigma-70 family RNA polymerase sigma factor [Jatrophihabitans sp.]|nr:sigma-70 family RNA polymerase sigma factor [Jatrophihabitans sp.]
MDRPEWLADRFEENRTHLQAVAYRLLGSLTEADDAVQEAWLRLSRSDTSEVENLGGWLTTVVARVSLDMLRSRKSRREEPLDDQLPDKVPTAGTVEGSDPEYEALLADSVGPALLVILERLAPSERLAFVLHDMFAVPFEEIGPIVGRSPGAARQLASRARRRVQGTSELPDADAGRQRAIVQAFLAASRNGDFDALLELLDPDVVLRTDGAPLLASTPRETVGASAVATTFAGRAKAAQPALIDGVPGLIWAHGGKTMVVFAFTVAEDRIIGIEMLAEADRLAALDVLVLD